MFVVQDLTIGTGSRAAQARFENLLHGNWLAETSQVACEGGAEGLLRVGPVRDRQALDRPGESGRRFPASVTFVPIAGNRAGLAWS
jgi:hypothetical protein